MLSSRPRRTLRGDRRFLALSSGQQYWRERFCMPDREKVLLVVREWLDKAQGDLQAAAHLLSLGPKCPCFTVCFHAQQWAEKYMKAMLARELIDFPQTHDLEKLMTLLPDAARPKLTLQQQTTLT